MAKSRPVTVVMISKDRAQFLPASIPAVLAQTHEDLDVWLVNDGSSDETRDVMEEFERTDDRVTVVHYPEPRRVAGRNQAITEGRGLYFAAIDDDDIWSPVKIEEQLQYADEHSSVGCTVARRGPAVPSGYRDAQDIVYPAGELMTKASGFSPSCLLTRMDHARAVGGYDEVITGARGLDFAMRLAVEFGPAYEIGRLLVRMEGAGTAPLVTRTGRGLEHFQGMQEVHRRYAHLLNRKERRRRQAQMWFRRLMYADPTLVARAQSAFQVARYEIPYFGLTSQLTRAAVRRVRLRSHLSKA